MDAFPGIARSAAHQFNEPAPGAWIDTESRVHPGRTVETHGCPAWPGSLGPNLLLWTGSGHRLALELKP